MNQPWVYICFFPPEPASQLPPHPTSSGCHRATGWAPCVMQQFPISYLFYTRWCIYFNVTLNSGPQSWWCRSRQNALDSCARRSFDGLWEGGQGSSVSPESLIPWMVCLNGSFWGTPGRNTRHWFPKKVGKSNSGEWRTKEIGKLHIILNFARLGFSLYNSLKEELLGIISGYFLKFLHKIIIATHSVSLPRAPLVIQIHLSSSVCVTSFFCTVFSKYTLGKKWNFIWKFSYLEKLSLR